MKLFYSPGACSLSPHIVLREAKQNFSLEKVDLKTKKTASGLDFKTISEKGYVPHLVLDNGDGVSEGVVMVQYIADLNPESQLMPKVGTMERVRVQEWLNYIATELHKAHSPLFNPALASVSSIHMDKVKHAYNYVAEKLKGKQFLVGDHFTVADAYLFTVLGWAGYVKLDLSAWPVLVEYKERISQRPQVIEALKAEWLM